MRPARANARKSSYGTSTLLIFYFFEAQSVMLLPLLKHAENLNSSIDRLQRRLDQTNPSDFRYKLMKSRLESVKTGFMSFRLVFENKAWQQTTNRFYYRILEHVIGQYK